MCKPFAILKNRSATTTISTVLNTLLFSFLLFVLYGTVPPYTLSAMFTDELTGMVEQQHIYGFSLYDALTGQLKGQYVTCRQHIAWGNDETLGFIWVSRMYEGGFALSCVDDAQPANGVYAVMPNYLEISDTAEGSTIEKVPVHEHFRWMRSDDGQIRMDYYVFWITPDNRVVLPDGSEYSLYDITAVPPVIEWQNFNSGTSIESLVVLDVPQGPPGEYLFFQGVRIFYDIPLHESDKYKKMFRHTFSDDHWTYVFMRSFYKVGYNERYDICNGCSLSSLMEYAKDIDDPFEATRVIFNTAKAYRKEWGIEDMYFLYIMTYNETDNTPAVLIKAVSDDGKTGDGTYMLVTPQGQIYTCDNTAECIRQFSSAEHPVVEVLTSTKALTHNDVYTLLSYEDMGFGSVYIDEDGGWFCVSTQGICFYNGDVVFGDMYKEFKTWDDWIETVLSCRYKPVRQYDPDNTMKRIFSGGRQRSSTSPWR